MSTRVQAVVKHRFPSVGGARLRRLAGSWADPPVAAIGAGRDGLPGTITTVKVDPRVGGAFEFADLRPGVEARHWGTYLALERPRTVQFTWITDPSEDEESSIVTVSITPDGSGCRVELVHDMSAEWREYVERTQVGWSRMLAAIGELCERAPDGGRR